MNLPARSIVNESDIGKEETDVRNVVHVKLFLQQFANVEPAQ